MKRRKVLEKLKGPALFPLDLGSLFGKSNIEEREGIIVVVFVVKAD